MKKKLLHSLGPVIVLLLLASAFWILHHELRQYQYSDIKQALAEIPRNRLLLSFALTILSYVALTGYDVLALRYIRHPLAYGRIALASFIGYALSHNIGLSIFSGSAVRYRFYAAWGLSTVQIAKVVAFCTLTFWLGILAIGGIVFLLEPMVIPASLHLPLTWLQPVGIICLVLVGAYVSWGVLRKTPITVREWEFSVPSVPLSPDLMRYLAEAPHGIMEYLFTELMLWGKREGYRWFGLGMAPLAGLEARPLAPLWNHLAGLVFRHGEHFYNFQGLRQFKEQFDPEWGPKYLASSSGLALPRILANIAALTSRGLKGAIAK